VLYHSRHRVDAAVEKQAGVTYAGKDDLLRQADIVLLILPYTPQTHHFIGARELSLMKRSAVLVNMARGGIVDDGALAEALKAGTIWAAGLDVYENEPRVNPALLELRNVVLTPHIASATTRTRQAMAMTAARNLVAALSGEVPPNLLNPDYRNHLKG
jgi:lactate dehydrogenase-like 2-hydroxyacid dehydrogenase